MDEMSSRGCRHERSTMGKCLVLFMVIIDVVMLLGVASIEYIFRWTSYFPIRNQIIECNNISKYREMIDPFLQFAGHVNYTESVIYIYSFSFPIILIVIGEILLFLLANSCEKPMPLSNTNPPHIIRRMYRLTLTYLFGVLCVMCCVDSLKCICGIWRPNYQQSALCSANLSGRTMDQLPLSSRKFGQSPSRTICRVSSIHTELDIDRLIVLCPELDTASLRRLRTSFPSMRAAISIYAAVFITVYIRGVSGVHHIKYLWTSALTIATVMLSWVYAGAILVVKEDNWVSDVIGGNFIGASMALFLTCSTLRGCLYQETVSNRRLLRQIISCAHKHYQDNSSASGQNSHWSANNTHYQQASNPQHIAYLESPVRLRRPATFGPTNFAAPTFRKSVTLPIRAPVVPQISSMASNHSHTVVNSINPSTTSSANEHSNHLNRLSMINLPPANKRSTPTISQELIDLLKPTNNKAASQLSTTPLIEFA